MIRVSEEAQLVRVAQSEIVLQLCRLQMEHKLTHIEMLEAINGWVGTTLKYMLRAERNPDDPNRPADEAQ